MDPVRIVGNPSLIRLGKRCCDLAVKSCLRLSLGRTIGTAVYKNNLRPAHDDKMIGHNPPNGSSFVDLQIWDDAL